MVSYSIHVIVEYNQAGSEIICRQIVVKLYNLYFIGNTYIRLQKSTDFLPIPHIEDGWGHLYYFKLEPMEREQIAKRVDEIVYKGNQEWNWFHTLPVILIYRKGKAVSFRRDYFIKQDEDGKAYRVPIGGDIVQAVLKEFPTIPREQLEIAIAKSQSLKKKNAEHES